MTQVFSSRKRHVPTRVLREISCVFREISLYLANYVWNKAEIRNEILRKKYYENC